MEEVILSEKDRRLIGNIDVGELEVIVLARDKRSNWALIDNEHARKAARIMGIPIKGTVGILVEGFRKGLLNLEEFQLLIDEIKARPDLWISDQLCDYALRQVK